MLTVPARAPRTSRRYPAALDVEALHTQTRRQFIRIVLAVIAFTALAAALLLLLPGSLSIAVGALVVVPALLVWLWRQPVRGVYILLAAAVVQETQYTPVSFADDIGHYLPFFEDFATWTHVKGLSFSLAEIFMLLVLGIWLLKGIADRTLRFERGTLMRPISFYMLMVLVGEAHGLTSGGDFRVSLWEVRAQVYMFVAYILACNLVKTRRQVETLIWILLLGGGIKGLQGTWRYLVTLHGNIQGIEAIFPHEQSFFYNAFLVFTPILFLYGGSRRLKRAALLLLPFVIVASLANQRRAAVVALGVAMVGLLLITSVAHPPHRRTVVKILLVLAIILPPYYLYYSNKSGLLAEPARAVASAFTPDTRDTLSNQYRVNEDKDIMATMRTSPIIGYGYGKPMLTPYPLADISGAYVFWNIMPHDSILWIWMRLGTIGYLFFWIMIGTAIVQATQLVRRLQDIYLKGLAVLIILLAIQQIIFGYLDLQMVIYRNLITLGVLFACIGWLTGAVRVEVVASARTQELPAPLAQTGMKKQVMPSTAAIGIRGTAQITHPGHPHVARQCSLAHGNDDWSS